MAQTLTEIIQRRNAFLIVLLAVVLFTVSSVSARTITIEFLQGAINQRSVGKLAGLACLNHNHIVHLDINVDWPDKASESGDGEFVFWNDRTEYLFPKESYSYLHGLYYIEGYFIVRYGGMHQGIESVAFEKIDSTTVMLNPNIKETKARTAHCGF